MAASRLRQYNARRATGGRKPISPKQFKVLEKYSQASPSLQTGSATDEDSDMESVSDAPSPPHLFLSGLTSFHEWLCAVLVEKRVNVNDLCVICGFYQLKSSHSLNSKHIRNSCVGPLAMKWMMSEGGTKRLEDGSAPLNKWEVVLCTHFIIAEHLATGKKLSAAHRAFLAEFPSLDGIEDWDIDVTVISGPSIFRHTWRMFVEWARDASHVCDGTGCSFASMTEYDMRAHNKTCKIVVSRPGSVFSI